MLLRTSSGDNPKETTSNTTHGSGRPFNRSSGTKRGGEDAEDGVAPTRVGGPGNFGPDPALKVAVAETIDVNGGRLLILGQSAAVGALVGLNAPPLLAGIDVLHGRGDRGVDEVVPIVPAVVLTRAGEGDLSRNRATAGTGVGDELGGHLVGGAVAGEFVADVVEMVDSIGRIDAAVVEGAVAILDVGVDAVVGCDQGWHLDTRVVREAPIVVLRPGLHTRLEADESIVATLVGLAVGGSLTHGDSIGW